MAVDSLRVDALITAESLLLIQVQAIGFLYLLLCIEGARWFPHTGEVVDAD